MCSCIDTFPSIHASVSIAEVERLWLRFEQMGATRDGVLTPQVLTTPALSSDVFVKNVRIVCHIIALSRNIWV